MYRCLIVVLFAAVASNAKADMILYDNGPVNGMSNAHAISTARGITNDFYLSNESVLTSAKVGIWVNATDALASLQWSIGTTAYGSDIATGTTTVSNFHHNYAFALKDPFTHSSIAGHFRVFRAWFPLHGKLPGNRYWLTLHDAKTRNGGPAYWDESGGASSALGVKDFRGIESISSESFMILGDKVTPSPEPASLTLLGIGIPFFTTYFWRRRKRDGLVSRRHA